MSENTSQRTAWLDLLRIFTCFCVVTLHTSAQNWLNAPVDSFTWLAFNAYDSGVRFTVPVFIMISGAIFLDPSRELSLRSVWTNRIPRLFVAYLAWSCIYALYSNAGIILSGGLGPWETAKAVIGAAYNSHYHLWYLPVLIGLYIAFPLLRCITKAENSKRLCEYFILLFIILGVVRPTVFATSFRYSSELSGFFARFDFSLFSGWFGYAVLGRYLTAWELKPRSRVILYILAFIGWIANILSCAIASKNAGAPVTVYYSNFSLPVFLSSAAVFSFFRCELSRVRLPEKPAKLAARISALTFGVYLVHAMVLHLVQRAGFDTLSFNAVLSVPAVALTVFALSTLIAWVMSKIPLVNRWLM